MKSSIYASLALAITLASGTSSSAAPLSSTQAGGAYSFEIAGNNPWTDLNVVSSAPSQPGHEWESYIYFDLSSLGSNPGDIVTSATLSLYTYAEYAAGYIEQHLGITEPDPSVFSLFIADGVYNPEGFTWSERPGAVVGSPEVSANFVFTPDGSGGFVDYWLNIDVAPLVQFWVDNPQADFGLYLVASDQGFNAASFVGRYEGPLSTWSPKLDVTVEAIPEPSTWALIGTGVAGLLAYRRRRK